MGRKHHRPEEIVAKLRQVEVLTGQGKPVADAVRSMGDGGDLLPLAFGVWRSEADQVRRLKVLEQENGRLRKACA